MPYNIIPVSAKARLALDVATGRLPAIKDISFMK